MTSPLNAVYEKFKHLDSCLSDPEWCTSGEGAAIYAIAGELWRAVKEARDQPRPKQPTPLPIDYLECARMDIRGNSYISGDTMVVDMDDVDSVISTLKAERARSPEKPRPPCEECIFQSQSAERDALIAARERAAENKRVIEAMGQLKDSCECVPLKEYAPDFDRGFHQAMTLVRGWIDQKVESLHAQPEPKEMRGSHCHRITQRTSVPRSRSGKRS